MNIIHRKNAFIIICIAYTFVSLSLTIAEIMMKQEMNATQLNIFLFFILSVLGVGVLSLQRVLDRFSPLVMMIIQYVLAIVIINLSLWLASHVVDIHPNGYHDMTISFTIPYMIGACIYYVALKLEIKKQNKRLKKIKE